MKNSERESGIELLRIIAAMAVIILHYNSDYAFKLVSPNSRNYYFLVLLEGFAIIAVDIYLIIAGYFMSSNNKRNLNKPLELLFQVVLIKLSAYCFIRIIDPRAFEVKEFIKCFIPNNYFVILYITLYFISPYINKILKSFNFTTWKKFLLINSIIFFVFPTLIDLFTEIFNYEVIGISPITAWGNFQGFNIVNFIQMYCIGAFLRFYTQNVSISVSRKKLLFFWFISNIIIFIWAIINNYFSKHGLRSAWVYHNPFVIISAISVFLFFSMFRKKLKIINTLSKASFFCFLLHTYFFRFAKIQNYINKNIFVLIIHIAVTCLGIYFISFLIYYIYEFLSKIIFKIIPRIEINYNFDEELDIYEKKE